MLTDRNRRILATTLVAVFVLMVVSPALTVDAVHEPGDINIGPYVDKVVFKMTGGDQEVLALLTGEIDLMGGFFDPIYLSQLDADPDIDIFSALRNGYGHITINCRDYPLNISAFRRAFAYAFDKTAVTIDIMDGFSREHDSLVPYPNGWCVEDEFAYHYYTDQTAIGAQILLDAGFTINGATGYLLAPNGDPFDVVIEYPGSSPEIAGGTAQIGVDALCRLGVNAETRAADYFELISRLDSHGDYDMMFFAKNFHSYDVDWLAYTYWSENADVDLQNPTNFRNATYDSYRDALLYSTTYQKVFDAAAEMQKVLQYNVPRLVVYENTYMQGYRNDVYTGHVEDLGQYITGPWTLRKIHKIDSSPGGTVRMSSGDPETFNIFLASTGISNTILTNLWPRLYLNGPNLTPWPYLAEAVLIETHSDNPAVRDGHTRFTIDIIQNATWTDETPLTADDVAFTYTYTFESGVYGNPLATSLSDLVAAYAPTLYRAVVEFNTESYWHFSNFAYDKIIPMHIFNDVDGIGYEGWNTWNPVYDSAEPYVTLGPYVLTDHEIGEFYELSANPNFCYYPEASTTFTTSTTSTPTTGTETGNGTLFNATLAIAAGAVGAAVVILVGGFVLLRRE